MLMPESGDGDADAPDLVECNPRVAAEDAAERRDVVDDGVAPARCAGGQGTFVQDVSFRVRDACGNVGAAEVDADIIHGDASDTMLYIIFII